MPLTEQNLDRILRILKDGQWHDMDEIAEKTKLSATKTQHVTYFLAKYSFVELDPENRKVKLSRLLKKFIQKASLETPENVC